MDSDEEEKDQDDQDSVDEQSSEAIDQNGDVPENEQDNEGSSNVSNDEQDANVEEELEGKSGSGPSSEYTDAAQAAASSENEAWTSRRNASSYSIVPYMASPQATSVHCIAATPCMRWVLTAGQDGYIRKYDFFSSIMGKVALTVAQRHPYVDPITRAGVLLSYWDTKDSTSENLDPGDPSPIYSLAVHSQGLWIVAGTHTGAIKLQTLRHDEGKTIHTFSGHKGPVSCLQLDPDEQSFLSGSWDKTIKKWDLNTGAKLREYQTASGQISTISYRPDGATVPISRSNPIGTSQEEVNGVSENSYDPLFDDVDEMTRLGMPDGQKDQERKNEAQGHQTAAQETGTGRIFMTSSIDGYLNVWDDRSQEAVKACWSTDGNFIYAARRNSIIDEYDVANGFQKSRSLKLPNGSGPVSALTAMPNNRHLICASQDNIRLWDLSSTRSIPFLIIPGHHGGTISSICITSRTSIGSHPDLDQYCRFMLSAGGNRGWEGHSTEALLGYEVEVP